VLPEPVERMAGGMYQWRGGEGSITDRPMEDQCRPGPVDGECDVTANEHDFAADTRPSTGLVYMRARYYDPAVGRFTQADPASYGPEMFWGQNNRWTYCANDPVNLSDPSGRTPVHLLIIVVLVVAIAWGLINCGSSGNWNLGTFGAGFVGGLVVGIGIVTGQTWIGLIVGSIVQGWLNGHRGQRLAFDAFTGCVMALPGAFITAKLGSILVDMIVGSFGSGILGTMETMFG